MTKLRTILIVLLAFVAACTVTGNSAERLLTDDGVRISYAYNEGKEDTGIILLHMLNKNRHDYDDFVEVLKQEGFPSIAIDLRGHGESDGDWQKLDLNTMMFDVKAAQDFLTSKGIKQYIVVGASIGANIALRQAAEDMTITGVVLLSPGLEYRGVKTEESAEELNVPALIIASKDDEYASLSAQKINSVINTKKQLILFEDAGHGTRMFATEPLDKMIIAWISNNFKKQ